MPPSELAGLAVLVPPSLPEIACWTALPAIPFTSGTNFGSAVVPSIAKGTPPWPPRPAFCITPPADPPLRLAFILKLSALELRAIYPRKQRCQPQRRVHSVSHWTARRTTAAVRQGLIRPRRGKPRRRAGAEKA